MRGIMTFCLLVGAVAAAPGFKYLPPANEVLPPTSGVYPSGLFPGSELGGAYLQNGGLSQYSLGLGQGVRYGSVGLPVVQTVNKFYHHFSAPEDDDDALNLQQNLLQLHKNLRVVFIKAPENKALTSAVTQLAKKITEDKTAIYVLSKQPDVSELTEHVKHLQEVHTHKPEVHFIKYKTQEEAELAKAKIQSDYDLLGGTSQTTHETVSGVHSIAEGVATTLVPVSTPAVDIPLTFPAEPVVLSEESVSVSTAGSPKYLPPDVKK